MSQANRCLVCNGPALYYLDKNNNQFCSEDCEEQYSQLMDEIDDNLNQDDEEE